MLADVALAHTSALQALADFLNCSATEVVFANNMSTGTFHLARALGRGWGPGDEIVITDLDHHANVAPWRALEQERGDAHTDTGGGRDQRPDDPLVGQLGRVTIP